MALSFGLTLAIRSRCASTIALELNFFDRIASASSLADAEVMPSLDTAAASAELINDVRPAAAAAPTSATVPRKSRRPILLLILRSNLFASRRELPFPATLTTVRASRTFVLHCNLSIFQKIGVAGPSSTPVSDFRHALG